MADTMPERVWIRLSPLYGAQWLDFASAEPLLGSTGYFRNDLVQALVEALALARSMILSGEAMSPEADTQISATLARVPKP